jgi:hypothetical protein
VKLLLADLIVLLAVVASVVFVFRRLAPRSFARCHGALLATPLANLLPARWRSPALDTERGCGSDCGTGGCGSSSESGRPAETHIVPQQIGGRRR